MIAYRLYIVPKVGSGTSADPYRPKYWNTILTGLYWGAYRFGNEPTLLICVRNIPEAVDAQMVAQSDVTALPLDLDTQVAAGLTTVRDTLEALNIPATWITASSTFREVVRSVSGLFQFLQRLGFYTQERLFSSGITLNTRWTQLSPVMQAALTSAAQSFGYSTASMTGNTTLRALLKELSDAWGSAPFYIAGIEL